MSGLAVRTRGRGRKNLQREGISKPAWHRCVLAGPPPRGRFGETKRKKNPRTEVTNRRLLGYCSPVSLHLGPLFLRARMLDVCIATADPCCRERDSSILGYNLASLPGTRLV